MKGNRIRPGTAKPEARYRVPKVDRGAVRANRDSRSQIDHSCSQQTADWGCVAYALEPTQAASVGVSGVFTLVSKADLDTRLQQLPGSSVLAGIVLDVCCMPSMERIGQPPSQWLEFPTVAT